MTSQTNGEGHELDEQLSSQLTSPTALRKLVLNYLVHHCYTGTAQAFAHDGISTSSSQMESSEEVATASGSKRAAEGVNGSASTTASSRSTQPATQPRSWSRLASQHALGQAHPLSAPPLSREDSSMEIEVDSLLSLAGGRVDADGGRVAAANGYEQRRGSGPQDVRMGDGREKGAGGEVSDSSEELSTAELRSVRIRQDIKDHILNGRIKQAIELCNAHFPAVLNADSPSSTAWEKGTDQGKGAKQPPNPHGKEREAGEEGSRVLPANPTSLYPAHISLNLQIQAFIESVRTASSTPSTSISASNSTHSLSSTTNAPLTNNTLGPAPHSLAISTPGISSATNVLSRSASPAPSSASSNSATSANGLSGSAHSNGGSTAALNPVLHAALSHAQVLFTSVQKLPVYWRAMYLKELESVTALLAYTDLERSPVRKYLDQSRRVALAEQINSAIMFQTGKPSQPLIESAVRQTSYLWSTLSNEKVVIPTDHAIFTSGTVVGIDKFEGQSTSASATERIKTKGKVLPPWNLHNFLSER